MKTRTSGQGRKKGIPNKMTMELKSIILGALEKAGGEDYLVAQARDNPTAFMSLLGKLIPSETKTEHTGKDGGPVITASISREEIDAAIQNVRERF